MNHDDELHSSGVFETTGIIHGDQVAETETTTTTTIRYETQTMDARTGITESKSVTICFQEQNRPGAIFPIRL